MSEALDMLHDSICDHLERIRRYFKIPVKLTIFVRAVGQADSTHDVFVSDDDVETAIAAIRRLHADPTASATGPTTTREEVFDALREGAAAIERSGLTAPTMTIAEEFAAAREEASRDARYTADAVSPRTCRYCGGFWLPFNGTALDGHAKCLIPPAFQQRLALVPGPQRVLAEQLGVTLSVLRAWIAPIRTST